MQTIWDLDSMTQERLGVKPFDPTTQREALRWEFTSFSRRDEFKIITIGDVHLGAAACDEELLREVVAYIAKTKNVYWIGLGDMIDAITLRDVRSRPSTFAPWLFEDGGFSLDDIISAQIAKFQEIFEPIRGSCLGFGSGNHEDKLLKVSERNPFQAMLDWIRAGVPIADKHMSLDRSGWIDLRFHRIAANDTQLSRTTRVTIKTFHGQGGGGGACGKANRLEKSVMQYDADIIIMGHVHTGELTQPTTQGLDDAGNIQLRKSIAFESGSFLRDRIPQGKDKRGIPRERRLTYSEVAMYAPNRPLLSHIVIRPHADDYEQRIQYRTHYK